MKKRWTAALLALCFVLSLAPYALAVGKAKRTLCLRIRK